jgi:outer membrane cobalamin receptor
LRPLSPRDRLRAGLALRLLAGVAAAALTAGGAYAQDPGVDAETEVEELVVNGASTPRGSVIGDITPELTISPREIRAYGAATVTELLDSLAPQTASGQGGGGRPVVLINGGRVSGFAEIRDLPTEAISRVEILPEEVSLKYGYPAEQKVVNIVLRQRFHATLVEGTASSPTQSGGGGTLAGHAGVLKILRGERTMLDAKITSTDPIYESDRDITGGDGAFRSLQAKSLEATLNAVYARPFENGVSATVNPVFEHTESDSALGVSPFSTGALMRRSKADDARIAASANGAYAGWQWSYTGELAYNVSRSKTDRAYTGLPYTDRTQAVTTSAQSDIVLNKALWNLPAGQVGMALTARASTMELESDAERAGVVQSSDLSRSTGQLQANFDVPITRAGEGLGETIGKLSGNVNLSYQRLSDFGDLETVGGGLHWTPTSKIRVLASFSRTDQAPTMNQLGDPVTATPGVRVFDLARGETAEVTRITGGNGDLDAGRRDVFKLGVTYSPFEKANLRLQANFVSTRVHDAIVAFPSASTQVEDAFPDRFIRDADGRLLQIDARPVNFARQDRDELRWGFTYSRPVGPQPTPEQVAEMRRRFREARAAQEGQAGAAQGGQAQGQGQTQDQTKQAKDGNQQGERRPVGGPEGGPPPEAGRGPGGGGGFRGGPGGRGSGFGGFGGRGSRGGVFQIGLYHTLAFKDEALIRPGLPTLDLLDGAALGAGGGSPRHQVDLQANYTRGGLGAAMNAKWQSATRVVGGPSGEDLDFSDLTTVNLRLFADLGAQPLAREHPWLRGARVTLAIDNIFDERQEVRTAAGTVPISYQPDLLDPVGRSVRLTFRKLIF